MASGLFLVYSQTTLKMLFDCTVGASMKTVSELRSNRFHIGLLYIMRAFADASIFTYKILLIKNYASRS